MLLNPTGVKTENVIHYVDGKAHQGNVIVIVFEYNKIAVKLLVFTLSRILLTSSEDPDTGRSSPEEENTYQLTLCLRRSRQR